MSASKNGDKPVVHLNLDTVEREGKAREQFAVVVAGRRILFTDPAELDAWELIDAQDAAARYDFRPLLRLALDEDDRAWLFSQRFAAHKLGALVTGYQQHYGSTTPGEAPASSAS